jgi:DNA-3-methyladenine glycosylase
LILGPDFYIRNDVKLIARELLGKVLVTVIDGKLTSGMITETEAYQGVTDMASHAYGGRFTKRTEVMYYAGGVAYVYLCYGIHSLFNIVTNRKGIPHAVLVRAIEPIDGKDIILTRLGKKLLTKGSSNGPGKVSKMLGIDYKISGLSLTQVNTILQPVEKPTIFLESTKSTPIDAEVKTIPRVGVNFARADADLPYRFIYKKCQRQ